MRDLAELWLYIADTSCRGYSPLYDRICRTVAESDDVLDLVEEAPPRAHFPVLLLAAVHYVVLGGIDHPLAAVYAGKSDADPGPLFTEVCLEHRDAVLELLATQQVNTNEVGRSAAIGAALTSVAARVGTPLAHLDVGCSAGLNLLCDRYRLDYGPAGASGPADARVHVSCEVVAGSPPIAPTLPEVVARVGLDRAPVDVHDPDQVRWQLACVWPDTGRLPRTRLALEEAQRTPMQLVRGDAVEAVGDLVAQLPAHAAAVVTTTWVVAYFSREQRAGFRDALAAASHARPIVWISAEGQGVVDSIPSAGVPSDAKGVEWSVLGRVMFAGGDADSELLGYVHPHGSALDWRASP
ncbi:MAG: DUF2332 domain-containing protein [Actinomycetota bacterium]|nr:DUF2332 domain-containing protein [Actinomycetota bacterium]